MAKKGQTQMQAPPPRNLGDELQGLNAAAQQFAQAQADAQAQLYRQQLDQQLGATQRIADNLNNGYTQQARGLLDNAQVDVAGLRNTANAAYGTLGGTDIERMLHEQAVGDLSLGGQLSPEQERAAQQSARAAYSARGLGTGSSAALAEVLNRDAFSTDRLNQRRAFASNVNQLQSQNQLARMQTAGSLYGDTARLGMGLSQQYLATDPYARALGSSIPGNVGQLSTSMTGQTYGNLLNYGQDLYNTNYNSAMAQYNSGLNNNAAIRAGQMQANASRSAGNSSLLGAGLAAGGSVLGAGIGALGSSGALAGVGTAIGAGVIAF